MNSPGTGLQAPTIQQSLNSQTGTALLSDKPSQCRNHCLWEPGIERGSICHEVRHVSPSHVFSLPLVISVLAVRIQRSSARILQLTRLCMHCEQRHVSRSVSASQCLKGTQDLWPGAPPLAARVWQWPSRLRRLHLCQEVRHRHCIEIKHLSANQFSIAEAIESKNLFVYVLSWR